MAKRIFLIVGVFLFLCVLFRGCLYRQVVAYESIGVRMNYKVTDNELHDCINTNLENESEMNIDEIIERSLEITASELNFTSGKNDVDPNKLIHSKTAHCVGYAAFYAATCNCILKKYKLDNAWSAEPQRGKIYFLGMNVHNWFDSSFLKDHDFVIIRNSETGEIRAVDPTLYDYLYIEEVAAR